MCVFILANSRTFVDRSFNVIEKKKKALLEFKHGLEDPLFVFYSWVEKYCYKWDDTVCNNRIGNVIVFLLFYKQIFTTISVSIENLSYLETLHLVYLTIFGLLPTSIINMLNLKIFDFSNNSISSLLLTWTENVSQLKTLNLSINSIFGQLPILIKNLSHL